MSAAGIVGLIKAVLSVEKGVIPPQAAFETAHPNLELDGFHIPTAPTEWPATGDHPRRAAVSSFNAADSSGSRSLD